MKNKAQDQQKLEVNVPENFEPVFSNAMNVIFKDDEFSLIFLQLLPMTNRARTKAIVSVTPQHMKLIHTAIGQALVQFETHTNDIKIASTDEQPRSYQ